MSCEVLAAVMELNGEESGLPGEVLETPLAPSENPNEGSTVSASDLQRYLAKLKAIPEVRRDRVVEGFGALYSSEIFSEFSAYLTAAAIIESAEDEE